jgi:hypothetical protein
MLWQLFTAAMKSLPGATIFCIIDMALRYAAEDELGIIIQYLCWLTHVLPPRTKLKLLITSPVPIFLLREIPEESQVLITTSTHDQLGLNDSRARMHLSGVSLIVGSDRVYLTSQSEEM